MQTLFSWISEFFISFQWECGGSLNLYALNLYAIKQILPRIKTASCVVFPAIKKSLLAESKCSLILGGCGFDSLARSHQTLYIWSHCLSPWHSAFWVGFGRHYTRLWCKAFKKYENCWHFNERKTVPQLFRMMTRDCDTAWWRAATALTAEHQDLRTAPALSFFYPGRLQRLSSPLATLASCDIDCKQLVLLCCNLINK